jgi:hypothetical protein
MQETNGSRALKREIRMESEGKVKRKICLWKRKEKRKKENEREKEKEEEERTKNGKKDMKWMNQVKDE